MGWRTEVWRGYYADASSSVIERRTTAHDLCLLHTSLRIPMVRVYLKAESLVMACRMLDPSLAVGRMTYASICDRPSANATLNHPNGRN